MGIVVSIVIGVLMYGATFLMSKYKVVIYSCILTGLLGCGLFTSGMGYVEKLCGGPVGSVWWAVLDQVGGSILYIFGVQSMTAIKLVSYILCAGTIGYCHYQRRDCWATLKRVEQEVKAERAKAAAVGEATEGGNTDGGLSDESSGEAAGAKVETEPEAPIATAV